MPKFSPKPLVTGERESDEATDESAHSGRELDRAQLRLPPPPPTPIEANASPITRENSSATPNLAA